jgi:hypothetical protein
MSVLLNMIVDAAVLSDSEQQISCHAKTIEKPPKISIKALRDGNYFPILGKILPGPANQPHSTAFFWFVQIQFRKRRISIE